MNDFKDLDLDYFAPRKPAEPEAKPEEAPVTEPEPQP